MSLKSQQYLENEPLNVLKLIVDRIIWIEMIEISSFNIFWQKYIYFDKNILKKTFTIALQYLENELRHLCPVNPIKTPEISFSMGSKRSCAIYVP